MQQVGSEGILTQENFAILMLQDHFSGRSWAKYAILSFRSCCTSTLCITDNLSHAADMEGVCRPAKILMLEVTSCQWFWQAGL